MKIDRKREILVIFIFAVFSFLISFMSKYYLVSVIPKNYQLGFPIGFAQVWSCLVPPCPEDFLFINYLINSFLCFLFLYFIYWMFVFLISFKKKRSNQ